MTERVYDVIYGRPLLHYSIVLHYLSIHEMFKIPNYFKFQ